MRHGRHATSFRVLEPGFRYWLDGDDSCVAYVDTGRAWVAAGAPIAARECCPEVARRFVDAARAAGRRACFFAIEDCARCLARGEALCVGEQPVWDPSRWPDVLGESRSLREQLRRARAKEVRVRVVQPEELVNPNDPTRRAIEQLTARWLGTRPMAPMGFVVHVHSFSFAEQRRCFVAEHDGRVVGFLAASPIYVSRGWFIEDFLRDPDAPNGTMELLIDAAMRVADDEQVRYATLGLAPLAGPVNRWLRVARKCGAALYNFGGLHAFKAKLRPQRWDPIYLSYPGGQSGLLTIYDTLAAFSRGGLLRFGLETLLRGPSVMMRVLGVLLVPWTILIALPTSARWFPSAGQRFAWVAFDTALAVALLVLSTRWRGWLADLVATVVSADALVTLVQALTFDAPRHHSPFDLTVLVVAVLAPTSAALLLWHARAHRAAVARRTATGRTTADEPDSSSNPRKACARRGNCCKP